MRIDIVLNLLEDGRTFLNYWDYNHGKDVAAEIIEGKIILQKYDDEGNEVAPTEVSISQFIDEIKKTL